MSENGFFRSLGQGCLGCLGAVGCCTILLILLCVLAVAALVGGMADSFKGSEKVKNVSFKHDPDHLKEIYLSGTRNITEQTPKIAVIRVRGVIVSDPEDVFASHCTSSLIRKQIRRAEQDPAVKAVILSLDTPGGEVTAADEIYEALKQFRSRSRKPLIGMMNSISASGGYYIASACSPVIARRSTLTGSIGVIISTTNYAGLFSKLGLENEVYASGSMKDMLNGGRKRTPQEVAVVRSLVEDAYSDFIKIVASSRKIPEEIIRKGPIGDGRIFSGKQALELRLVDSLGTFDDALQTALEKTKLHKSAYTVIRYEENMDFFRIAGKMFSRVRKGPFFLLGNEQFVPRRGVLYYLPGDLF